MKIIKITVVIMSLIMMFNVYACAFLHFEPYMSMEIPDDFVKVADDGTTTVYRNTYTDCFINIARRASEFGIDYRNLTSAELKSLVDGLVKGFNQKGTGAYLTAEPVATSIRTEFGKEGVNIQTQYIDPTINNSDVLCEDLYVFSHKDYDYLISFISYSNYKFWVEESLASLNFGQNYAVYNKPTTTTEAHSYYTTTTEKYTYSTTTEKIIYEDSSDVGAADVFETMGKFLGVLLLIFLLAKLFGNKK